MENSLFVFLINLFIYLFNLFLLNLFIFYLVGWPVGIFCLLWRYFLSLCRMQYCSKQRICWCQQIWPEYRSTNISYQVRNKTYLVIKSTFQHKYFASKTTHFFIWQTRTEERDNNCGISLILKHCIKVRLHFSSALLNYFPLNSQEQLGESGKHENED